MTTPDSFAASVAALAARGRRLATAAIGALAVGALALAGGARAEPPPDESKLLAAGFKIVAATTKEQQEHLQALPRGQLTGWQRTGKHYYVYPDLAKNQLYVGTPKEYEAYRKLVPATGATLAQQHAADMRSYQKQDSAMQLYTNRDLADPYYFWNSFDGLGFR